MKRNDIGGRVMALTTLGDIVRLYARDAGERLALTYDEDGRCWTFAELNADANRVAAALHAAGVGPGVRIAYLDKNAPEYFLYLLGGAKLGAVCVAVNWRLAAAEMEYILNDSGARTLVIGSEFLPQLAAMQLAQVEHVFVLGEAGASGYPTFAQWIADHDPTEPAYTPDPGDTCYQLYTSGTTGLPKGVELTHANFMHCLSGLGELQMNAQSVNLVCMPLFHIAGSGWGVAGLYAGAHTVLLRDVDLHKILASIPHHRVTHSLFVPAVLQFLLSVPQIRDADLSSLRSITYGASPITEKVLVDAMHVFGCAFNQAYGLTETTGAVCLLRPEDHDPGGPRAHLLRSCGRPMPGNEVRIVDPESLADVSDGSVGEIWIRGPQNMKGYWKNPQATAAAIVDGGWLRTGDAGYLRDGYVFIHDRVKDMIISGGENIYPAEVENVLMRHDGIADAAVIGVPSDRWGETVKAIVVRRDPTLHETDLIAYCRARLAHYKCPTSVDWADQIPRNPSGKVLKTALRERYWAGRDRRVS
jgi:long-chain acyl-CoA synthetase